ncbi:GDSL-type esterase/lipase family protein [Geodermatophilus sp. SYSU D00742]
MTRDLRVCFVGDSFVAGVGDPEHLGWVGRLCARTHRAGQPLTAYGLGVRRQTSRDVRARIAAECAPRLSAEWDSRVVVSFGVNDTTVEDGALRVPPEESAGNLAAVLAEAAAARWSALVVGPPPIADPGQDQRIAGLDVRFRQVCAGAGVPYVGVRAGLGTNPTWVREVAAGDGAHPAAAGYQECADLLWPRWQAWIDEGARPHR